MADLVVGSVRNGQVERYTEGRITYAATATVVGGKLVEATTGERKARHAVDGSLVVVGVALYNAAIGESFTVDNEGVWLLLAHGAVTAGMRLIAYTGGAVQDAGATPDARKLVGYAIADADDAELVPVRLTLG